MIEINIKAESDELAALVIALQERPSSLNFTQSLYPGGVSAEEFRKQVNEVIRNASKC